MKTYKLKSLVYLGCFILAAVFYNNYEQKVFQEQLSYSEIAETEFEDSPELKKEDLEENISEDK